MLEDYLSIPSIGNNVTKLLNEDMLETYVGKHGGKRGFFSFE